MSKNKEIKTNAMRILDRMKISYTHHTYECDEFVDGMQIVEMLGLDPGRVYKTLVTRSPANEFFVFVIPVAAELDLKKAAKAAGQKSLAMIKQYETVIDSSARDKESIVVSGGRIGSQIELAPEDLAKASNARFVSVCAEGEK